MVSIFGSSSQFLCVHALVYVVFDHQLAIGGKNKRMKKESMNHINDSRQILSFFGGGGGVWTVEWGRRRILRRRIVIVQAADRSHDDDTACMQNNSASSCYVNINIVVSVSPSATCRRARNGG